MFRSAALIIATFAVASFSSAMIAEDEKKPDAKPAQENQPANPAANPLQIQIRIQPGAAGGATLIRGNMQGLELVGNEKVQDELKLDAEQKAKIKEAVETATARQREVFGALRGVQGDERAKKLAELNDKNAEAVRAIKATFKPEQTERFDQISLQVRGLQALGDAPIVEKLKITDEQTKQIKEVAEGSQQKRIQLFQDIRNGNIDRTKVREKQDAITKDSETKTMDVLTDEQKAQFEKMKGAKFDMPQRQIQLQAVPVQPGQLKKIQARQQVL